MRISCCVLRVAYDEEHVFVLTSAGGVVLHDFYNTVEKTFRQISLELDGGMPSGEARHQPLVLRMTMSVPGRRPAVIDQELSSDLMEYLRFRHLFRGAS